jgi:hypothetical protein
MPLTVSTITQPWRPVKDLVVDRIGDNQLIDRALKKADGVQPAELKMRTRIGESSWRRWRKGDRRRLTPKVRGKLEVYVFGRRLSPPRHGAAVEGYRTYVEGLAEAARAVEVVAMRLREKIAKIEDDDAMGASGFEPENEE